MDIATLSNLVRAMKGGDNGSEVNIQALKTIKDKILHNRIGRKIDL